MSSSGYSLCPRLEEDSFFGVYFQESDGSAETGEERSQSLPYPGEPNPQRQKGKKSQMRDLLNVIAERKVGEFQRKRARSLTHWDADKTQAWLTLKSKSVRWAGIACHSWGMSGELRGDEFVALN